MSPTPQVTSQAQRGEFLELLFELLLSLLLHDHLGVGDGARERVLGQLLVQTAAALLRVQRVHCKTFTLSLFTTHSGSQKRLQ